MFKRIFDYFSRVKKVEATVKEYHGQTDIMDLGFHLVTLSLNDGREAKVLLENASYQPFGIGEKITGEFRSDFHADFGGTHGAQWTLTSVESDNPYRDYNMREERARELYPDTFLDDDTSAYDHLLQRAPDAPEIRPPMSEAEGAAFRKRFLDRLEELRSSELDAPEPMK